MQRHSTKLGSVPVLLAAITLVESAASATTDPHQAAQNAEIGMMTCFYRQAASLDDHVSDASTIARAVVGACHPQFDDWKYAYFAEFRPVYSAALFYQNMERAASGFALQVVLKVRTAPKH